MIDVLSNMKGGYDNGVWNPNLKAYPPDQPHVVQGRLLKQLCRKYFQMDKQQQMEALIEQYKQSGISIKEFCKQKQIGYHTLQY